MGGARNGGNIPKVHGCDGVPGCAGTGECADGGGGGGG